MDSGELAAVIATGGVSHPSGSPLYLLVGALVAVIPLGSLIVRLNALSAVCAAVSVALTFAVFGLISRQLQGVNAITRQRGSRPPRRRPQGPSPAADRLLSAPWPVAGAIAAALAWMTNRALWGTATVTEVYALHALLFSLLTALLVLYAQTGGEARNRALALASLVTGLGLSNYPPLGLFAPAVLFLLLRVEGRAFWTRWRRNLAMLALIAIGLLPYALLPIRASADPLINWGNPSNWRNFWAHVSGQQYQVFIGGPQWSALGRLLSLWGAQWPAIIALFMPLGLWALWRARRTWFWFTLLIALANLLYAMTYDVSDVAGAPSDLNTYLLPLFWVSALWIGAGVALAAGRVGALGSWRVPVSALAFGALALLPLLALPANWEEDDRRAYTYADDYARGILNAVAPNALMLAPDWTFVSPAWYLQLGEGVRPDVTVLDGELLRHSWYFSVVRQRAPWLYDAVGESITAYLRELSKYENNEPYDGNVITQKYVAMLNNFIAAGLAQGHPPYILVNEDSKAIDPARMAALAQQLGRPPYMTIGVAPDAVGRGLQWAPETPAFRLYNDRAPHPLPPAQIPSRPFSVLAHYDDITRSVIRRYAEFWRWRGDALRGAQDCFEARAAYQQALNLAANLPEARAGLNACQSP